HHGQRHHPAEGARGGRRLRPARAPAAAVHTSTLRRCPMFELKPLSRDAIPRSLERAERYRVLNEPAEAESICLDVLGIDHENQEAIVTLLLALTDQFESGGHVSRAQEVLPRVQGEYQRAYYAGIVSERRAKARLKHGGPGSGFAAYAWFREAM